jgi:hypothetical protein
VGDKDSEGVQGNESKLRGEGKQGRMRKEGGEGGKDSEGKQPGEGKLRGESKLRGEDKLSKGSEGKQDEKDAASRLGKKGGVTRDDADGDR